MKIYGAQLTGSIASTGNPVVTGSLTVSGNLTAQQFIVSSSVTFLTTSFSSGSTKFGDSSDDNHNFTGSVLMTGSLTVVTTGNEFQVNAGGVNIGNALTDNHIISGSVRINPNGLFVSSSGVVGIGTTSLVSDVLLPVQINAIATTGQAYFASNNNGGYGLLMGYDNVNGYARIRNVSNTALTFETNNTEKVRITSAGNVGIGTTSPDALLTVAGANQPLGGAFNTYGNALIYSTDSFAINKGGSLSFGGKYYSAVTTIETFARIHGKKESATDGATSGYLAFETTNDATALLTERMRITSTGNVGIGTTSPLAPLYILAPTTIVDSNGQLFVGASDALGTDKGGQIMLGGKYTSTVNTAFGGIAAKKDNATDGNFGGYFQFFSSTHGVGNTEKMRITSTGNVGIGTTSPSVKLDVNGQIKFNSIATTDYSISFSGIGAGAWFNIPEFNFNGFYGLATISIQNDNSSRGYTVRASAWIFQTGINGLDIYGTLRSVTIRPDGTSYEGLNVVESYHTAPSSGRYNMRMRLVVREAGLGAANPLNLQIWVDNTASFPASGTLLLKAI